MKGSLRAKKFLTPLWKMVNKIEVKIYPLKKKQLLINPVDVTYSYSMNVK